MKRYLPATERTYKLFFPSPFPDEFHAGYFGRLAELNGLPKDRIKAMKVLKAIAPSEYFPDGYEPQMIQMLAFAAAMTLPDFVRGHTLLPYRRAIASHKETLLHGDPSDLQMLRFAATRVAREGAYFCANCINEDIKKGGMSYWRRSHQIPGLLICSAHGTALRYMETEAAFRMAPSQCMPVSLPIDEEWAIQSHANPLVAKFIELSLALASSDKPLPIKPVRQALVQIARQKGISVYAKSSKELLSDRIVAHFPQRWLESVFPGITAKHSGEMLHQIDGVLYLSTCSSTVAAYLLAICMLFDSNEQALEALASIGPETVLNTRVCVPRAQLDFESLLVDYVEFKGSHAAVARKRKMPTITLTQQLRNLGLPNLTLSGSRRGSLLDAAYNFFIHGLPMAESAKRANVMLADLERIVRYAGVELIASLKQMSPTALQSKSTARLGKGQLPHRMSFALRVGDCIEDPAKKAA
ncbi:TniQ family protein [Oxalobacteraceae bacterium]|nr:TniQ family protein [Oxalobacteraceae bacterium]